MFEQINIDFKISYFNGYEQFFYLFHFSIIIQFIFIVTLMKTNL
jgi:hypothetical protein